MLVFDSDKNFEYILIFSLLSQQPVKLINPYSEYSSDFIKLLKALTTNTSIIENGDHIIFTPGAIIGGKINHHCKAPITLYLMPLIILAPFSRSPFLLTLTGITNGDGMSIDVFKRCIARTGTDFDVDCHIKIIKRGFAPEGNGIINFKCNTVNQLKAIETKESKLVKITGIAISAHCNASVTHNLIDKMRDKLKLLTGNIKMHVDIANREDSGPSPGYACVIFAESNNGNCIYGECRNQNSDVAVRDLCMAINNSEYYDYRAFNVVASYMCLCIEDYGRVSIKRLEEEDFEMLKLLNIFFGFEYKLDASEDEVFFGAFGVGYKNIFKVMQ